ncbi:MAG: H4MPT-linked C1 transfer pathway protein [Planctomycetes bacterium]|nr:H4MPT-linked C1 transfer pathway protein [Planctomycetota bacterium]
MNVLGWDIGGANLKAAHSGGTAHSVPFELWKRPGDLAAALAGLAGRMPPADLWAVTMTGELCDCFETKGEGVHRILEAAEQAARGVPILAWQTCGRFVRPDDARSRPLQTAASNWHALATLTAREFCPARWGLLIDVGSTTTDLVLLGRGRPCPAGLTDPERLASGELVYSGVRRTPLAALVRSLPYRGRACPVAAELFATTLDVCLLLGLIPERPESRDTADGRAATRARAADRMVRMICADRELCTMEEAESMARAAYQVQVETLSESARRVVRRSSESLSIAILAGSGEFLARRIAQALDPPLPTLSLAESWGDALSGAACAWSVAQLAT